MGHIHVFFTKAFLSLFITISSNLKGKYTSVIHSSLLFQHYIKGPRFYPELKKPDALLDLAQCFKGDRNKPTARRFQMVLAHTWGTYQCPL